MKLNSSVVLMVVVGLGTSIGAQTSPDAFEAVSWRLVSLPGVDNGALDDDWRFLRIRFDDGRVTGFSGCNHFTGTYTADGSSVTVAPLGATLMACPEPAMEVERTFRGAFSGAMTVGLDDDRMTLTAASGAELAFEREYAPTFEGTTWTITSFNNGQQAVVTPVAGSTLAIKFDGGTVSGDSGCNSFRGSYTLTGSAIAITPLASSRKACRDQAVMDQESLVLAAIQSATTWEMRDGLLDLVRADGTRALTAHPRAR